jgi:hypothetical protein
MSRTTSLFVILTLTAGSVVSGAAEQSQIVGAWRFVSDVSTRDDGTVVPIAGPSEGYEGLLIYTADGFVSANVMPKRRKWTDSSATRAQLQETIFSASSTAYSGRYHVDPLAGTVTHSVLVSVDPEFLGRQLVRNYTLDGDTLRLTGTWNYRRETLRFTVLWRRVR